MTTPPLATNRSDIALLARFAARAMGKVALVLAIPAAATAVYIGALHRVGELLSPSAVAALSASAERIVWLSGYYDTGFLHKVDVAKRLAPQVAVLGSSRAMQLRAQFFSKTPRNAFYNLGGCCLSIEDTRRAVHALVSASDGRPRVILLGIERNWFQVESPRPTRRQALLGPLAPAIAPPARAARDWLSGVADRIQVVQQAWRDPRFRAAAGRHFAPARDTAVNALLVGIAARVNRSGFRNDGSYRPGQLIEHGESALSDTTPAPEWRSAFRKQAITEINQRAGIRGAYLADYAVHSFEEMIDEIEAAGVKLIVFVAPMAPSAFEYYTNLPDVAAYSPKFSSAIGGLCAKHQIPFLDAFDSREFGASDEDFYDWLHASERLTAKVMLRLYADPRAGAILAPFGDAASLQADLAASRKRWQLYDF